MSSKPRIVLLNRTCFEVWKEHRTWLQSCNAEFIVDDRWVGRGLGELPDELSNIDGCIGPTAPITAATLRSFPCLRVISLASSGFDSVDVDAASAQGIAVTNATPCEGAEVVADLAWALLLSIARQIPIHDRQVHSGNLSRGMATTPWRKTLGIVGLGQIGRAVARRASGFEMQVLAVEPTPDANFVAKHNIQLVTLEELIPLSDYITLHVRLTAKTKKLFSTAQFARMKPTAFLINAARRELVDEVALIDALDAKKLAGAALDDGPSSPHSALLKMENVIFTPHIGNRAKEGVDAVLRCAVTNAVDVLAGRPCRFVVNPEIYTDGTPKRNRPVGTHL